MKIINYYLFILDEIFCIFYFKIYREQKVTKKLRRSTKKRIKRYIRPKFRNGSYYNFRTGKLKFFSIKAQMTTVNFKKLEFKDKLKLKKIYDISEKQVEHPTFYHLVSETKRLIKFNKTHSKKIYNEQTNRYVYIGKGEDGRREYVSSIKQCQLKDRDLAIGIRDIIAEGRVVDFEIPGFIEEDLVNLGVTLQEIRSNSRVNELDK